MNAPVKYYYLFIGHGAKGLDKKSERFVIESAKRIEDGSIVDAKIVARNKNAAVQVGYQANNWVNPVSETRNGMYPVFIRVHQDWVTETKFFEKSL